MAAPILERKLRSGRNDDDRARRVMAALLAHGPQKETGEAAVTPGADDERGGAVRSLEKHRRGCAVNRAALYG